MKIFSLLYNDIPILVSSVKVYPINDELNQKKLSSTFKATRAVANCLPSFFSGPCLISKEGF